jgi:hypothetical protein
VAYGETLEIFRAVPSVIYLNYLETVLSVLQPASTHVAVQGCGAERRPGHGVTLFTLPIEKLWPPGLKVTAF